MKNTTENNIKTDKDQEIGIWKRIYNKIVERFPFVKQGIRYVTVGVLNTLLDFTVLNLLMWTTGIYKGKWLLLLNLIAFSATVINGYIWNKRWTFEDKSNKNAKLFINFLLVSVSGAVVNSTVVYLIATHVDPFFGIGNELWANIAKITAAVISVIWNFTGYKFIVFKK